MNPTMNTPRPAALAMIARKIARWPDGTPRENVDFWTQDATDVEWPLEDELDSDDLANLAKMVERLRAGESVFMRPQHYVCTADEDAQIKASQGHGETFTYSVQETLPWAKEFAWHDDDHSYPGIGIVYEG